VQAAAKELRDLVKEEVEKLSAVLTAEQKQKLQTFKDDREEHREECLAHAIANLKELDLTEAEMTQIGEIREEYRPKMEKAAEVLSDLLTDEQKKARTEALAAGKNRKEVWQSVKLTNEQREKIKGVAKELGSLLKEEVQKIGSVLAAGEKEKLQEARAERKELVRDRMAHRIANREELALADEQKEKLAAIRQEYRPKIQEAGNKLRASVREEVQMIAAVIK
jgi:Spy/CpxP family protein refolding chaperone